MRGVRCYPLPAPPQVVFVPRCMPRCPAAHRTHTPRRIIPAAMHAVHTCCRTHALPRARRCYSCNFGRELKKPFFVSIHWQVQTVGEGILSDLGLVNDLAECTERAWHWEPVCYSYSPCNFSN